jgi:hypothetical protein
MKIKLEGPYAKIWRLGYLVVEQSGRKIVLLSNSKEEKTTISYAKYLMSIKLNRLIDSMEIIGHKDDNFKNDVIDNLVLMTKSEKSILTNQTRVKKKLIRIELV